MEIDGHCLCGAISYEATIDPDRTALCHCTDCRINSGTAFRWAVQVHKDDFRLLTGELKSYIKTAQSGAKRALTFCPECGTSLYGTDPDDPQLFSLRVGTATQAPDLVPRLQVWNRSALGWVSDIDAMRKFEEQP